MSIIPPFATGRNPYNHPYSFDVYDPFMEYNNFGSTTMRTYLYSSPHHNSISSSSSSVGVEWRDTPQSHVFKANLPGFRKEDVKVYVSEDGKLLKITGEKNIKAEEGHEHNGYYQVQHCSKSQFMNQFVLPQNARADQLRSSLDKGVLTVTIPKKDVNGHHQHVRSIELK